MSLMLFGRCLLFKGLACFIKWRQNRIRPTKQNWMEQCLEALKGALERDANDHLVHFYLALTYALCRQIGQALVEVQTALRLRAEHLPSLILLALLLSTPAASPSCSSGAGGSDDGDPLSANNLETSECHRALALVEATLDEYPQNFDLLYIKSLMEEQCYGGEAALASAKHMLALWKQLYEDATCGGGVAEANTTAAINHSSVDCKSAALSTASAQPLSNEMADRDGKTSHPVRVDFRVFHAS